MVNIAGCDGLFEPLLDCLEDQNTPCADRVDAYMRLTGRLREEEDVFASEVCANLARLIFILKVDIQRTETDLCQAALQALGHCMYQEQIAHSLTQSDGNDILKVLAKLIKSTMDKSVCTRALWCIAKQNLASDVIISELDAILSSVECIIDKQLQSVTVDHEALAVIQRLLLQLPRPEMIKTVDQWSKFVFPLLTSSASKVRERALEVLSLGVEHMVSGQDKVFKILMPQLKGALLKGLTQLSNDNKELFVLKAWSHLVPILGKTLHRGGMLINEMLKLVEQGFKNISVDVQVMAYTSWNVLIDNFALSPEILCTPKRRKLLMMPLLNTAVRERHVLVEMARLATWWHLVCVIGPQITELFDQVCSPLLQFLFGSNIEQINHLKNREGFRNLRCPPTPTNNNLAEKMAETPRSSVRRCLKDIGTPKTPTVKNTSFSHGDKHVLFERGCEILEELLQTSEKGFPQCATVERLQTVVFKKPEDFRRHSTVVINTVREALRSNGREMRESLCHSVWSYLVDHIQSILERGQRSDHGEVFLPLLAITQEIVDNEYVCPVMALKMLEKLSRLPSGSLSHHTACLHSKENPQGSPALLLVQLLFTQGLLGDASTSERFHVTFEHLINCGMTAMSGQFSYLQTVLNLLDKGARSIANKDTLWRLWSSATNPLNDYITKTNDVNQGDALEHDFSTIYMALTFPVKHIMDRRLQQPTAKQLHKSLGELYRSFARAAALVSTAEVNVCADELCGKLRAIWDKKDTKDAVVLAGLVNLLAVIIENIDFSVPGWFVMATTAAGKSPNTTPTKWAKRQQQRPMGNLTNVVQLLAKMVTECDDLNRCKEIAQSTLLPVVASLIDSLSYLSAHINGSSLISAVIKALASALVTLIIQGVSSRDAGVEKDKLVTPKMAQKVEKLWLDLLTCIQSRHGGPFDSELLKVMSPLLAVTLCHPKRQFRNQTVLFWNATFALSSSLEYPESIRSVLQSAKDKMSLHLPNWNNVEVSVTDSALRDESDELTQSSFAQPRTLSMGIVGSPLRRKPLLLSGGSPQLVKGSFLHKAAGTKRAVENLSPKKTFLSPKTVAQRQRNSPSRPHARRKLPLSLYEDDHQDYVAIAPSPKRTRLLTEHQKDIMKSKRVIPTMYNILDQSQDGTQFSTFTQDTLRRTQNSPTETSAENSEGLQQSVTAVGKHSISKASEHVHTTDRENTGCEGDQESASLLSRNNSEQVRDFPARDSEQVRDLATHDNSEQVRELATRDNAEQVRDLATPDNAEQVRDLAALEIPPSHQVVENVVIPETMEIDYGHVRPDDLASDIGDPTEAKVEENVTRLTEREQSPSRDQQVEGPNSTSHDVTPTKEDLSESITSPDVIPSSQTSPFQSLRRVSIPLSMVSLPLMTSGLSEKSGDKVESLCEGEFHERVSDTLAENTAPFTASAGKASASAKDTQLSVESVVESLVDEEEEEEKKDVRSIDHQGVESPDKNGASDRRKKHLRAKSISPVSGRTRGRVRNKTETSTPSRKTRLSKSKIRKDAKDENEDKNSELNTGAAPLITPQLEKTSELMGISTVSSPKIKFVRSLAVSASPSHSHLRAVLSPAVSPSGGILKRFPAKQAVDSPSPPGKVRRVSFAIPPQDSEAFQVNEQSEKVSTDEDSEKVGVSKEMSKQAFTAIKPRPTLVSNPKAAAESLQQCMYPELVQCNLPVEQVLPSLNTTWSRALGQVVHAQNIRTVGNLSALKDYQVRNLPIKSPKVETLKRVLHNFHRSQQKGRGGKDKTAASIGTRKESVDENTRARKLCISSAEDSVEQEAKKLDVISETEIDVVFKKPKDGCLAKEQMEEDKEKGDSEEEQGKSYTPPLPTNTSFNSEDKIMATPKRTISSQPTVLASRLSKAKEQWVGKDMEAAEELQNCEAHEKAASLPLPADTKLSCSEESQKSASPAEGVEEILQCFSKEEPLASSLKDVTGNKISPESSSDTAAQGKNSEKTSDESILSAPEAGKEPEETPNTLTAIAPKNAKADGGAFCRSLASAMGLASPEVLSSLSSDDVFRAHQNLTELMGKIGQALRSKARSPKN